VVNPLKHIIKLFSFRGKKFYCFIKVLTSYRPKKIATFELAFVHKSSLVKDVNKRIISNERLEFLGDALLGSIIAAELYKLFPNKDEGFLTKTRSRIVNRAFLNEIAYKMGLIKWVKVQSHLDVSQTAILGDVLEAIIGAVYVDGGFEACRKFVLEGIVAPYVDISAIAKMDTNYKSMLIEWAQKNKCAIDFITHENHQVGDATASFISFAQIDGEQKGQGHGVSKKIAQQNAACEALKTVSDFIE